MNEMRKEAEERDYLLELANKDKLKLRNFIRLVDYVTIETLISTNLSSIIMLFEEMKKDRGNNAIFFTTVVFNENLSFDPDEQEFNSTIGTLLDEMIDTVKKVSRIVEH